MICFFFFIFFALSNLTSLEFAPVNIEKIITKEKEIILKEQTPTRDEINNIITSTITSQGILNKLAQHLIFDISGNPLLFLPIVDLSKDLGVNYGIMPVLAIREKKTDSINSVIAPSINHNKYLGYTYTYRHYIFPTEKSLFVARLSFSNNAQQEVFFRYYDPQLIKTKTRLNIEYRNWHNPKSSFYGYGIDSSKSDRANYTFYLNGGEISISLPLTDCLFVDWTPSYYIHKIRNGIVDEGEKFSEKYPYEYNLYNKQKNFFTNKFSFFIDTTDHPFIPKIGSYIILSFTQSNKRLLSDYTYSLYTIELKDYYNYKNKSTTAIRFLLEWQTGEKIPFYRMPQVGESTGLRMAGDGRFVDRARMLFNIEQRMVVVKASVMRFLTELEFTPFIDIGTVAPSVKKLSLSKLKIGPGFATRIVLRPQIVGTADFAFGSEGLNTIVKINYPF